MSSDGDGAGRLTLRAVEVFIAVIDEGSISGGARRLGASPSSVSQQVSNLEASLGATLVDRTARPLALTPAGFLFQRRALAILDEATRARAELADLEHIAIPELRFAAIEDFDADLTPALAAAISARSPATTVVGRSGPSHQNIVALEQRVVDMVIVAETDYAHDWIERHPLLRDPYVLITARGLLDGAGDVVERLMAAPMVRYTDDQFMGRQIETHLRRLRLAPPQRYRFDNNHAIMAMVERARGWAIATPLGFARAPRFHPRVEVHPLPFRGMSRSVSLFARRDVLGSLPGRIAGEARSLLERDILPELRALMPWLDGALAVIDGDGNPVGPGGDDRLRVVKT